MTCHVLQQGNINVVAGVATCEQLVNLRAGGIYYILQYKARVMIL